MTYRDGALLSQDRLYRYELRRKVSERTRPVCFMMLNPSTADEEADDPTINRCKSYATLWECGQLIVVNLFAFRATKPEDLKLAEDPFGPLNDHHIRQAAKEVAKKNGLFVCAWGNHGSFQGADMRALNLIREIVEPRALAVNKDGSPKHPLYEKKTANPFPYLPYRERFDKAFASDVEDLL